MRRYTSGFCIAAMTGIATHAAQASEMQCYQSIEQRLQSRDAQGHGPDIGSEEWKLAIEHQLKLRDKPGAPSRDDKNWCRYVDQQLKAASYACGKVEQGSIEAMVCGDKELSALERKLSGIYVAATNRAAETLPTLKAEQRGWRRGVHDCWKSEDRRACARDNYVRRIAELQARYRLVSGIGPLHYQCETNHASEVVVTFFQTDPATLIAERGDDISLMYVQPSASGARYQGRNEMFWEHQGEALVTWGYGAPEMRCKKVL